jgi:Pretoxin HINT domain
MKFEIQRCPTPFFSTSGGCFIKGTRVQTQQGLKRIEDIKVGDYVLSSPEDGTGKAEYKRVVNTFVHSDKTITSIGYYKEGTNQARVLKATGNHPFWVEGIGWTRADLLKKHQILRMADGSRAEVSDQFPVYRTHQKNIGWVQQWGDIENSDGSLMDYANYAPLPATGTSIYLDQDIYNSDEPYLRVDVYNLEVEDFHTYYVGGGGSDGIWVHNTNCTGVELANGKGN